MGGIHGAGKGTVCANIQQELEIEHLSASQVLKWSEVSPDISNKLVKDISSTQDRLITGLQNSIDPNKRYLLDGHFCLFDWNGTVTTVPVETFLKISPILISVLTCDPVTVTHRLKERDGKNYDIKAIKKMQNMEVKYAKLVAERLNIPCIEIADDVTNIIKKINTL